MRGEGLEARIVAFDAERLDRLATLVHADEARAMPMPEPDPIATILAHRENRGRSRRDPEPAIGSRARVAEVLNRKRADPADDPPPPRPARHPARGVGEGVGGRSGVR